MNKSVTKYTFTYIWQSGFPRCILILKDEIAIIFIYHCKLGEIWFSDCSFTMLEIITLATI